MGRVRRNQRDAIRKQRAKRRSKQSGGNDSDSEYDQEVVTKRRRVGGEKPVTSDSADFDSVVDKKEPVPSTAKLQHSEGSNRDESKPKAKAPVDKIERMRLKKQQQKARNKEKKAARAAEAAARSALKKDA